MEFIHFLQIAALSSYSFSESIQHFDSEFWVLTIGDSVVAYVTRSVVVANICATARLSHIPRRNDGATWNKWITAHMAFVSVAPST